MDRNETVGHASLIDTFASIGPAPRYRLIVLNNPESGVRVQVIDCERGYQMFDWRGVVAERLLDSGELDRLNVHQCGCYPCDKYLVCHLALVAAAYRSLFACSTTAH